MSRVFINYRRSDASAHANLLYDWIRERYGEDRVFKDVDSIAPGLDFVEAIEHAIDSSEVMLVVIGKGWLVDADGRHRLEDVDDYVRMEVATALRRNIRVVPVLVEGAEMPTAAELPEPLANLTRRHAFEINDARTRADRDELLRRLDTILGPPAPDASASPAVAVRPPDPQPEPVAVVSASPSKPESKPTKSLVRWGWISAGGSLFFFPLAAVSVILGALAISRSNGQRAGMGMAIIVTAILIGLVSIRYVMSEAYVSY
jgi:hypothetical protein